MKTVGDVKVLHCALKVRRTQILVAFFTIAESSVSCPVNEGEDRM